MNILKISGDGPITVSLLFMAYFQDAEKVLHDNGSFGFDIF